MKTESQIKNIFTLAQQTKQKADAALDELNKKIAKLQDGTRTYKFVADETAALRDSYSTVIGPIIGELNNHQESLEQQRKFYENKGFLLSLRPTGDLGKEPESRAALIAEAQLMDSDTLRLRYELAVHLGNQGAAFLLGSVFNTKQAEASNKINFEEIELPFQSEILGTIDEARRLRLQGELTYKEAYRGVVTPMERMNAARGYSLTPAEV